MSISYYLVHRQDRKEMEELRKFWEEELYPAVEKMTMEFFENTDGRLINPDLGEEIVEGFYGPFFQRWCPVDGDFIATGIGAYRGGGFVFKPFETNNGEWLYSIHRLKQWLTDNPEYMIENEEGVPADIDDLIACLK